MDVAPSLSIVVPCYNEGAVLPETIRRLRALLDRLLDAGKAAAGSHAIFVDDGSSDETWEQIKAAHAADPRMRGIKLSANRGHQTALLAGLFSSAGQVVISIDADLQDDLNAMELMLDAHRAGSEVVYGVRRHREMDTLFKRTTAHAYYRLLALLGVKVVYDHADYRLIGPRALAALKQYPEVNLFLRGIVPSMGFRSSVVYYDRGERFAGETKYSLRKMLLLALDGITSFTTFPLRIIGALGLIMSMASVLLVVWVLWTKLFTDRAVPGWASLMIPIDFLGGLQLFSIGLLGEYVAKTYLESKRRPRYFIEEEL